MALLFPALYILVISGILAWLAASWPRLATGLGVTGAVLGSLLGLLSAGRVLLGAPIESIFMPWHVPYGAFAFAIDPLSAFFLLPIFLLAVLTAIYGAEYLGAVRDKAPGPPWFFFNLLVASMALVVVSRNAVLFLLGWELMTLSSFFLVTRDHEKDDVRRAGWTYLVAAHAGTACVMAAFILLGAGSGALDFNGFAASPGSRAAAVFLLALIGFGTKAGLMPFHVWLPEAHPAAPSHVSALMSAVMIKTGLYGLLRILTFLGPPPAWWGELLIGIGLVSGVIGVLFALAQQDLKRALAYSSVENIGIVALGFGLGLLGVHNHQPALAVLGMAGALLHILNHALCKGLLFLGAGSVLHATGTRSLNSLGGLLKRMPKTGAAFLVGAAAISALPPFNAFAGEWLLYLGAFTGIVQSTHAAMPFLFAIGGLALIGGLAAACFTRLFGIAFLGEPRDPVAEHAHESGKAMCAPMLVLAGLCLLFGLSVFAFLPLLAPVVARLSSLPLHTVAPHLAVAAAGLQKFAIASGILLGLGLILIVVRRPRAVAAAPTWDCGYAQPTPRMQYTAASFAQPIVDLFGALRPLRKHIAPPQGLFPDRAVLATESPDLFREKLFAPLFRSALWVAAHLRRLQQGSVQVYILYIALTLLFLLMLYLR